LGERRSEALGEGCGVDRFGELDVEVLGVALVADGEGEAEAHLRSGREALGEREWQLLDAGGALGRASDVSARDETHLAALRDAQPHGEAAVAPHRAPLITTGSSTGTPKLRPCPVPWLPPAGATAEATTCSSA